MKKLEGLIFKANLWTDSTKVVEGAIHLRDRSTLHLAELTTNRNGYLVCLYDDSGTTHIVDPNTVELVNELACDLQKCESCEGRFEFEKIKSDAGGNFLCESCYDTFENEAKRWKCKTCERRYEEFEDGEEWADENLCSTCNETK